MLAAGPRRLFLDGRLTDSPAKLYGPAHTTRAQPHSSDGKIDYNRLASPNRRYNFVFGTIRR